MTVYTDTVPMNILDGSGEPDDMIEIRFEWVPGQPPSGLSGPPENYDPGSGDEFNIVSAYYVLTDGALLPCGLAGHEEERVIDYLDTYWERPEPDFPEPPERDEGDYDDADI